MDITGKAQGLHRRPGVQASKEARCAGFEGGPALRAQGRMHIGRTVPMFAGSVLCATGVERGSKGGGGALGSVEFILNMTSWAGESHGIGTGGSHGAGAAHGAAS